MKIISIISFYFLTFTNAQAALEGDYVLSKGPKSCPTGSISLKTIGKERNLIFGSQLSWTLNLKDKSEFKEIVEEGCTYATTYEKELDSFKAKTVRSLCPNSTENSVINEEMELKNNKLLYKFEQTSQPNIKSAYTCTYSRSK